jgi:hypothetical protein
MTTQYTPILKLALPVQGELSGTWGDVVNDNITSMIEQAIAGRSVVNTWTANSHVLTTANGTAAESRAAMLSLTDTGTALTGAGSVVCPALSKTYIVKNGTAQVITVKTASGSGIAVPVGKTMLVYCDGTNVLEGVDHVVTLSAGTLTITGLTTFASLKGADATTVTGILDEDNMASDSATKLVTQQSVKAYVDSQVGANNELSEVLANGNTTGSNDIDVDADQKVQFRDASIYINSSADGQLDIVADTEIQIATATVDLNGNLDVSGTALVTGTLDVDGATQLDSTLTVGVNDTGHDVKFFGASSGSYMLWDESADDLILGGAAGLTIAGDIDVDGTTNLDVVDIDGAVDMASTLAVGGVVTANAGVVVDNFTLDGTTLALSSGDFTVDVAGDIILDADGDDIRFKEGGNEWLKIRSGSTGPQIISTVSDHDISFRGNDGGSEITALTLDMSAAGAATFNDLINIGGSSLNFTKVDGVGINAKESLSITIDSDNNDASRVFSVLDGNGTTLLQVTDAGEATFNQGAVFNEAGVDSDFRVESNNNTHALFVQGSDGFVGLGTSSPSVGLEVALKGANPLTGTNFDVYGLFGDTSGGLRIGADSSNDDSFIGTTGTNNLQFVTYDGSAWGSRLTIANSGAATFSSTIAATSADLRNTSNGAETTALSLRNYAAGANTATALNFYPTQSTARFASIVAENLDGNNNITLSFLTSAGDTPAAALTLDQNRAATFSSNVYVGGDLFVPNLIYHTGDLDTYMQFHQADGWRVVTAGSERFHIQGDQVVVNHDGHNQDFRVESDGDTHALFINGATNSVNVGSAYGGNSKFTVNQSASEITCYLQNTLSNVGSTTPSIIYLQTPNDSVIADGFKMVTFADQDTVLGSIATAGSSTQIAYNTSSDERLKENIVDAGSQLDTLLAVKVREYDWKKNGFHSTGFIAQELHEHIPEAVTVGLEDPTQHPWSVDYGRLTPFIIKAMQEQQELIKTLEARIAALES